MKTYEKYLISEAITAPKSLDKLKKFLSNISTPLELRMAKGMIVDFIKKFNSYYTDSVSDELSKMLMLAQKKVKR
jgi:hypothetical protein